MPTKGPETKRAGGFFPRPEQDILRPDERLLAAEIDLCDQTKVPIGFARDDVTE